jgi:hypothetical protein
MTDSQTSDSEDMERDMTDLQEALTALNDTEIDALIGHMQQVDATLEKLSQPGGKPHAVIEKLQFYLQSLMRTLGNVKYLNQDEAHVQKRTANEQADDDGMPITPGS